MRITIETQINAPLDVVWSAWTTPADIVKWNAASDDWHTPEAMIDLQVGGVFNYRMEARDGSFGFDFTGKFTKIVKHQTIEFVMDDDREVSVEFVDNEDSIRVRETFEAESENDGEMQRRGWQSILDNFARHVESKAAS